MSEFDQECGFPVWQAMSSRQRKDAIKDRQAFARHGWPATYPPEKDPLAPRKVNALPFRQEFAPMEAPVSPGMSGF